MAEYRFLTTWLLDSPRQPVWDVLYDVAAWPRWWDGVVEATELEHGEPSGVGTEFRLVWRSRIPYRVAFRVSVDRVEPPRKMSGSVVGELRGGGAFRLLEDPEAGTTAVLFDWRVSTTRRWMNLVAPLARPVFARNHDWVMTRGGEGLAALLGCRLLAESG